MFCLLVSLCRAISFWASLSRLQLACPLRVGLLAPNPRLTAVAAEARAGVENTKHANGNKHRRCLEDPKHPLVAKGITVDALGKLGDAVDAADLDQSARTREREGGSLP